MKRARRRTDSSNRYIISLHNSKSKCADLPMRPKSPASSGFQFGSGREEAPNHRLLAQLLLVHRFHGRGPGLEKRARHGGLDHELTSESTDNSDLSPSHIEADRKRNKTTRRTEPNRKKERKDRSEVTTEDMVVRVRLRRPERRVP